MADQDRLYDGKTAALDMTQEQVNGRKRRSSRSPELEKHAEKAKKLSPTSGERLAIEILPTSEYRHRRPIGIQAPTQLASFSFDEKRQLHHDDRSLRFYHPPPRRADLNYGFDRRIERDESVNEHLDALLQSLMRAFKKEEGDIQRLNEANIVTWRGMMTKLCTVLYEDRQGFEMNAMLIGNTMYLEEHSGAARKADKARQAGDVRQQKFSYYGYSFESYCCHSWQLDPPQRPSDPWDGDVNTNVQWCSVVKTKLGDMRVLIGGEVDAVDPTDRTKFVEVKTSVQIRNARDEERFEGKMLRFYMQSFLLGVRRVVVGFRDFQGFLVTHQEFDTLTMPRAVRGKPHAWDPLACFAVALDILTEARRFVQDRTPFSLNSLPKLDLAEKSEIFPVFRIAYDPVVRPKQVSVRALDAEEILREVKGGKEEGRVGFVTSDYYTFVQENSNEAR